MATGQVQSAIRDPQSVIPSSDRLELMNVHRQDFTSNVWVRLQERFHERSQRLIVL
jgi:hypothetical protein